MLSVKCHQWPQHTETAGILQVINISEVFNPIFWPSAIKNDNYHACLYASLNWVMIGSDNGLPPVWYKAIIKTNDEFSSTAPQGTEFNEKVFETNQFSLTKFIVCNFAAILSRGRQINPLVTIIWELWCRKQVSQAGISNCIPQYSVGCNYLSLSEIPASAIRHGWPCSTLFQVMADCWCKPSPEQGGGGGFKNTYELLNLRALKFSPVNKI